MAADCATDFPDGFINCTTEILIGLCFNFVNAATACDLKLFHRAFCTCCTFYRDNIVKLSLYYDELSYTQHTQLKAMDESALISMQSCYYAGLGFSCDAVYVLDIQYSTLPFS